jgi:hypothetical protein
LEADMTVTQSDIVALGEQEIEAVAGGGLFLPLLAPFVKGALTGATAAGLAYAIGDALDLVGEDRR